MRQIYVKGELHPDGSLTGKLNVKDKGFRAVETRRSLQSQGADAFLRDSILSEQTGVSLSDVSVRNEKDIRKSVQLSSEIESADYAQSAGGMMYLNPQLVPFYTENPLKRKQRTFPVDFAHPRSVSYIVLLRLPEGYTVEDAPSSQRIKLPNDDGEYVRLIRAQGRQVMFRSTLEIREPRIPPQRYPGLRELFSRVTSAQSSQIVLKEEAGSASSPSADENSNEDR